jgi:hypothetical protein
LRAAGARGHAAFGFDAGNAPAPCCAAREALILRQPLRIPLGVDDFREIRERALTYVDKTRLVCDVLDLTGVQVLLLPRPRRFGKSLNLSMMRCFFERSDEDLSHLFEHLAVWQAGEPYRAHFQRYPVIYLNFKDVTYERFEDAWWTIREKIRDLYRVHRAVLDNGRLSELETRSFRSILDGSAPEHMYERALQNLSGYLHRHHGERVVILIDEYDQPIHAGYASGYTRPMSEFLDTFLGAGLKSNPHLYKAVLTGIVHVAPSSIFSGFDNLVASSLLRPVFSTAFGFTEAEVVDLLARAGRVDVLPTVQDWYGGFVFGGQAIYDPLSVMSFLQWGGDPEPYCISTSFNDPGNRVRHLLGLCATRQQPVLEGLLAGDGVVRIVAENVALDEHDEDAFWSLLVFSGYLKAEKHGVAYDGQATYRLTIPNLEIRLVFLDTFHTWMETHFRGSGASLDELTRALLRGDAAGFERQLQAFATNLLSYHDAGTAGPENLYQGFIIGLLAVMEPTHLVRSNRESGAGRPDVQIRPRVPGQPGVVMELKVARASEKTPGSHLDAALDDGLAQLAANDYAAELRAAGADPVHAFAVAFDGKQVRVRSAG